MVAELEKLANVINGRTVCVLGLGPSLGELDKWIQRFKNKDICWVSLNDIRAPRMILNKIGKDLDIILGCALGLEHAFDDEKCYVHRYSLKRGNTISEFIWQLNDIKCDAYLIGFDGYCESGQSYYYSPASEKYLVTGEDMNQTHKYDTEVLNKTFNGWNGVKITTVGNKSKYAFPKIEWFNFFRKLGMEKSISILLPTRDRPLLLSHMLLTLDLNTKNKSDVEVLIAHDEDDDLTPHIVSGITSDLTIRAFRCKRRINLHSYYNELFRHSANKYVMCINDDSEFLTKNWDEIVLRQMPRLGYGWIDDGLLRRECNTEYCCFPIVSREFHDVIDYIQDERWYCGGADINLYYMYEQLGLVKYMKDVRMGHLSYHNGTREKDATSLRINSCYQDVKFDKYPPVSDMEKIKEFVEYYKKSDTNVIRY